MTLPQVQEMLTNHDIIDNLEYFTTGSGTIVSTSRIRGFVRDKKEITMKHGYGNVQRMPNFYYTFDKANEPAPTPGTLMLDETLEWITYIDADTGRKFYVSIDDIKIFATTSITDFNYGAGGQII